jgi:hypothetical protein
LSTTKSIYALFGAGFHGKNGLNPVIIMKLWLTYILPRLLYSTELWMLEKPHMEKLEVFQREKLRQLQNLPEQCPNIAVLGLCGLLPIQGEIDKRALNLYRNIAAHNEHIEHSIAVRQLAVKGQDSHSWFVHVDKVLLQYKLPDAHELLRYPPQKQAWKKRVKEAVTSFWEGEYKNEADRRGLTSIRYMSTLSLDFRSPAPVWTSATMSPRESYKARIKAKVLTGCLTLQVHEARFKVNQHQRSPTCRLCSTAVEAREHFILHCPALQSTRMTFLNRILALLDSIGVQDIHTDPSLLMQVIIDPHHEGLPEEIRMHSDTQQSLESLSRDLIYFLFRKRLQILNIGTKRQNIGTKRLKGKGTTSTRQRHSRGTKVAPKVSKHPQIEGATIQG